MKFFGPNWSACGTALLFFAVTACAGAQAASTTPATARPARKTYPPITAKLRFPLDVSVARAGTRVEAYVQSDWTNGTCDLRFGSLLEGHVSQATRRTHADKNTSLTVVFDAAECNRHRNTPLNTLLVALLGPDAAPPGGESGVGQNPSLTDVPNPIGGSGGFRSIARATDANRLALTGHSVPTYWKLGMVIDVPATTLAVGKGVDGGSTIAATGKDARLEANTLLILAYRPPEPAETHTP